MLHLITGTSTGAKKEFLSEKLAESADAGKSPVLIVPEQSAFARERDFLLAHGALKANRLAVTGFSRMIRTLLPDADIVMKPEADGAARNILMSLACEDASEGLEIYSTHRSGVRTVAGLLSQYDELRRAGYGVADIVSARAGLPEGSLKKKLRELSEIFAAYEALLGENYSDAQDNVPLTTEYLKKHNFLAGRDVFIDDFRGLTAVQIRLTQQMILSADDVWVSVFVPDARDVSPDDPGNGEAFAHAGRLLIALKTFAKEHGVRVFVHETGGAGEGVFSAISRGFYAKEPKEYAFSGPTDALNILTAPDKDAECRLVALEIRDLVEKEDIRCSQVAVVCRDASYIAPMTAALRRARLPVYRDRSCLMTEFPVARFLLSAVTLAAGGFDTETVLSYLKSGMTGVSAEDAGDLENYVYIWQLDGKAWESDFTGSPFGFGTKTDAAAEEELARVNAVRRAAVAPVLRLKNALREAGAGESIPALWEFLEETDARERFCDYAQGLLDAGDEEGALACSGVWDKLIDVLDAMHRALSGRTVTPERVRETLEIMLNANTVGTVPAGLDEIVIGQADRIRFSSPRAVFLIGCNKGVFPAELTGGGLFSSAEKRALSGIGIELESTPEREFDEERLITLNCVLSCENRLYVSHSLRSLSGEALEPSEIVTLLTGLVPGCRRVSPDGFTPDRRVCSPETAFSEFASAYGSGTAAEASLREYCAAEQTLASRLPAMDKAFGRADAKFEEPARAREFFGDEMTVSPSRAEKYYSCPFGYFCDYGLGIAPPEIAGMDNRIRGNMIHEVLDLLLKKYPKESFIALSPDEVKTETAAMCEKYIEEYLSGRAQCGAALNREFDNVEKILPQIVARMQREFAESDFVFRDTELTIGDGQGAKASPYEIPLADGGKIRIVGKVDRADTYENEDGTYLRIIDYKSGHKDFAADDMLNGFNLQMPMYLFCLTRGGVPPYGGAKPAGFLYQPAKADDANEQVKLGRNAAPEETDAARRDRSKLFGCVLDDPDIIRAMNKDYMKASAFSPKEFRGLEKLITEKIAGMGENLHRGRIEALPLSKDKKKQPCGYCRYRDVCRREDADDVRGYLKMKYTDMKSFLEEKEEGN